MVLHFKRYEHSGAILLCCFLINDMFVYQTSFKSLDFGDTINDTWKKSCIKTHTLGSSIYTFRDKNTQVQFCIKTLDFWDMILEKKSCIKTYIPNSKK